MTELFPKIKNIADFLKVLDEFDIQYVDFNFTDMRGKWQHTAQHTDSLDKDLLENGIFIDGSSIAGWKAINESDMLLVPDVTTACIDPFAVQPTVKVFCTVAEPKTGDSYHRCPRSIAIAAEAYLKSTGIADIAYFGPEAEFFVFDDVRIHTDMNHVGYRVDSAEGPYNRGTAYDSGNMGHRPGVKGGYFPEAPVDSLSDIRAEMLSVMKQMGVPVEKHHHEVAPSQCELGILYASLVESADNIQRYKHVVHNVAHAYGK
ncbi:MAG: glutamine synthetase beta-grasp domain-containing protein, partial [Alphaproteobacteria bacterium]|nr:glutamine synthetase beta-grasp domain-containing protein [Alphaproteobacteria bacterium]